MNSHRSCDQPESSYDQPDGSCDQPDACLLERSGIEGTATASSTILSDASVSKMTFEGTCSVRRHVC